MRDAFPHVTIKVYSHSVGGRTEYQGWDVGIDCLFPDKNPDECDNVAISIGIKYTTTEPEISEADVSWGAEVEGDGCEIDLLEEPIPYSEENLQLIESGLRNLFVNLRNALTRNKPLTSE